MSLETTSPTLSAIYIYPIKSCRGFAVNSAELDNWGFRFDRNWMLVTPNGRFITQRDVPQMALIETAIEAEALHLKAPGQSGLELPLSPVGGTGMEVEVWGDRCLAIDQGDGVAAWFSQFLGIECRLVRLGEAYNRPVKRITTAQVSFADGYPLLLISEASLADLNQRLPEPIPMNRFRPNLVVSGCDAYAEDTWQQIRIGLVTFDLVKPCERCVITTTDQATGRRESKEPLKTLATYRRNKGGVIFGQNVIHRQQEEVQIGSRVEVLAIAPTSSISVSSV